MQIEDFFRVYLFTYFWLHWVFVAVLQLSLVMVSVRSCGVRASHGGGFSCYKAWALGMWTPQLWRLGLVAPRHVGSSGTRDRTCVPCIGRQTLDHQTTREALQNEFIKKNFFFNKWCLHVSGTHLLLTRITDEETQAQRSLVIYESSHSS